jgi:hypothetical protein
MTKKRIITLGVAFIAVIACAVTALILSQKSAVKSGANEQQFYQNQIPALPDGKYYAYGDTSRPYYELNGNTIQLHGISFDVFVKTQYPNGYGYFDTLSPADKEKVIGYAKENYARITNVRDYTLFDTNYMGKFIGLDYNPTDETAFSGEFLPVTEDGVILGFTPSSSEEKDVQIANGGIESVPYVLVSNPALRQAQTFPDEYDISTPASATGHTIYKVAKPNDSFKFDGETETSTEPTIGETD